MPSIEQIARVAHEANRGLQQALGEKPSPEWDQAPQWARESSVKGVRRALASATPEQLHEQWYEERSAAGWSYGPVRDDETQIHPCLVPWEELPHEQRLKDALFASIVTALATQAPPAAHGAGPAEPRATVGRIVHYVSHGTPIREDGSQAFPPACRAATVTEVDPADPGRIGLTVQNPTGTFFHPLAAGGCRYVAPEEQPLTGGTWHWPERV